MIENLSDHDIKLRRKKLEGYNFRQASLDWNEAFLTDEGVLGLSELDEILGGFRIQVHHIGQLKIPKLQIPLLRRLNIPRFLPRTLLYCCEKCRTEKRVFIDSRGKNPIQHPPSIGHMYSVQVKLRWRLVFVWQLLLFLNDFPPPSHNVFAYVEQINLAKHKCLSTDLRPPQSVKGTKIGQNTTPQTQKLGLQMPSPSLQFFDQPKSSASQSNQSVNVRIQLSDNRDSGIPIARKRSQSNCPVEPKHLFKLDETAGLTKGSHQDTKAEVSALSSSSKCSVPLVAGISLYTQLKPRNVQIEANMSASVNSFNQTNGSVNHITDVDKQEVKEENTISYIHDEVGQIRHEVILSSELTHTSLCYTYLAMVQRDDKLEKQGTVRKKGHYEVESTLDDVQVGMELSGKQLPLHGGFPDRFQMITFQKSKKMAEIQRW